MKCSVDDCTNEAVKKKVCLCGKHYARLRRHGDPTKLLIFPREAFCLVEGCNRTVSGKGFCELHRQRAKKYGNPGTAKLRRKANGEGSINKKGYKILVINGKAQKEHRLVVEKALGKPLPPTAIVHHLNGDKTDNRPCNLVVCPDEAYHQMLHRRQQALGYNGPAIPQSNAE